MFITVYYYSITLLTNRINHTFNDTHQAGLQNFHLATGTILDECAFPNLIYCLLLSRRWRRYVAGQAEWDRDVWEGVLVQHVALLVCVSVEASEFGVWVDGIIDQDTTGGVLVINYQGRWIAVVTSVL